MRRIGICTLFELAISACTASHLNITSEPYIFHILSLPFTLLTFKFPGPPHFNLLQPPPTSRPSSPFIYSMCTLPIIPLFRSTSSLAPKTKFTLRAAIKNVAIFLDDICFVMQLEYVSCHVLSYPTSGPKLS
jgi:hypothetical protein